MYIFESLIEKLTVKFKATLYLNWILTVIIVLRISIYEINIIL